MSRFEEQAGLEVVHHHQEPDLEALTDENGPHPHASDAFLQGHDNMKEVVKPDYDASGAGEKIPADEAHASPNSRKRPLLWIIIAVVAVVVIVAAVVGGVLGSKGSKHKHSDSPSDSSSSNGNAANSTITKLRPNSPLAVTGWRMAGKSNIQLFWQGKDDLIYYSAWDSGHKNWVDSVQLNVSASSDTPMAAGVIYQAASQIGGPPDPQVQFFYRNTTGFLNGENFRTSFPDGLPDSINTYQNFTMGSGSALASYWPSVLYESASSGLVRIWYHFGYQSDPDSLTSDSVSESSKSPLAILPLQRVHPTNNATNDADLKLFYRRNDGGLYEFDRWSNGTITENNNQLKGFQIAKNSSLAAFANARDNTSPLLNSYIVYQTSNGTIEYGTNTDARGWVGPQTDDVFKDADVPTNIACVTAAASTSPDIPLTDATELNRCYFQSKGNLVEVMYNGSKWSKLGTVSLPS